MRKFLTPPFLKSIDKWLMLNSPMLWVSNLHFIIYYVMIGTAIQATIAWLFPLDFRHLANVNAILGYLVVPVLLVITWWIIKLIRYNIQNTYVHRSVFHELYTFFLYGIVITLISTQLYVMPVIFNYRNANTITEEENYTIDRGLFYLEKRSGYNQEMQENSFDDVNKIYTLFYRNDNRLGSKSIDLEEVFSHHKYYKSSISQQKLLTYLHEFVAFHNKWYPNEPITMNPQLIINQYILPGQENAYEELTWKRYNDRNFYNLGSRRNRVAFIDTQVRKIDRAKEWRVEIFNEVVVRVVSWAIIGISFLLWIVSVLRWRQILAVVVTFLLSPIAIALISVTLFGLIDLDDDYAFYLIVIVYMIFLVQTIKGYYKNHVTSFTNVITAIVSILFPFVPMTFMLWLWQEVKFVSSYHKETFFLVMEILIFIFVLLSIIVFSKILKKHYALPRTK